MITTTNRFAEVEQRAITLMGKFENGDFSPDVMGKSMDEVRKDFLELMKDEKGDTVIDADVSGWLFYFLSYTFIDWDKRRRTINAARQRPEMTSSPNWKQVESFEKKSNEQFRQACAHEVSLWKQNHQRHNPPTPLSPPKKRSWLSLLFSRKKGEVTSLLANREKP